jgi:hypothetical protein
MSDKNKDAKTPQPGDDDYVAPVPPAGYVPGGSYTTVPEGEELPTGQWVGERGEDDAKEVHPTADEIRQQQIDLIEADKGGGGASPDTAAAGAEHKDR